MRTKISHPSELEGQVTPAAQMGKVLSFEKEETTFLRGLEREDDALSGSVLEEASKVHAAVRAKQNMQLALAAAIKPKKECSYASSTAAAAAEQAMQACQTWQDLAEEEGRKNLIIANGAGYVSACFCHGAGRSPARSVHRFSPSAESIHGAGTECNTECYKQDTFWFMTQEEKEEKHSLCCSRRGRRRHGGILAQPYFNRIMFLVRLF